MASQVPTGNYYVTLFDDTEASLVDVVFFGIQDGNLLFARPDTTRVEPLQERPPVAPGSVIMSDSWQSEGAESVDLIAYALEEVRSVEADWSVLHPRESSAE
ncbi:hypothetical protein [Nocardioides sp. GY 10127]|uniref:hypothetical protein n=1 Tax=Nocardioides sp. GY 10127 TaxID=2569762 RepID=UPI0010A87862|nr:hypothetical protein [Nocardioides sp. GY 10127]TIC85414.1 hypothetical protein E8D37_01870 [Nocardioides sp. GY 10127]